MDKMKSLDVFSNDKQTQKKFTTLKLLFVISGVFQGITLGMLIKFFPCILNSEYKEASFWLAMMSIGALISFTCQFIGTDMGNEMAVWEVCDKQIHKIGEALIKLPLGWFNVSSKGKVSQVIASDTNTLSHLPSVVLPEIITTVSLSLTAGIIMSIYSIKIGIVLSIMAILLMICWNWNLSILENVQKEKTKANEDMASMIVEFSQLQPVLRSYGTLKDGWKRLDEALEKDKNGTLNFMSKQTKPGFFYMTTANVTLFIVLALLASELINKTMSVGTFLAVSTLMIRIINPLASLLPYGTEIYSANAAMENINSIINAEKLPISKQAISLDKSKTQKDNGLDIELKEVNFAYVKNTPVIKGISLKINAGSMVAIVGPSGSGKSTITRLIARFWDADFGQVLIDGKDVKDIEPSSLMDSISMVFQDVYLFNISIKDNIAMANPNASEQQIIEACRKARLLEVIERLPNGFDTIVSEGGNSLSGGEKQRVSIARAFLKNAPILLLDEITSALDGTNESIITASLQELSKDKTVIVIAHRLSSIKNADNIIVIDKGKVVEQGKHEELIVKEGMYANLWDASCASERWVV